MSTKTIAHTADLPALVERYFCEYLIKQRNATPETISSYRDAFRLFLRFSEQRFGKAPAETRRRRGLTRALSLSPRQ